ncbi:hypothetical protein CPHO_12085 [Corynebacterium phocae]|uniref:Uncharacterized protein n=1 Tax=Corynebacterium phocae TaxID=161895 RepID=A0A1L7D5T7_9CORY|nr:hypothetical protein [Corynebacterium phocae]APT93509.1 hypothetical protein CPHO_12085 [Corynebacterium phocae]KAA8720589.1 hypothetical protein F4V58_11530 [Corynebacterium phocae]
MFDYDPLEITAEALHHDSPSELLNFATDLCYMRENNPQVGERFINLLLGESLPEAAALLAAVATLGTDDLMKKRSQTKLQSNRPSLPQWLYNLEDIRPVGPAYEIHQYLGDISYLLWSMEVPGAEKFSCLLSLNQIDDGTIYAFLTVPRTIDELLRTVNQDDTIQEIKTISLQKLEQEIDDALEFTDCTLDLPETDNWPQARPLLKWLLNKLPQGPELSDEELDEEERALQLLSEETLELFAADANLNRDERARAELIVDFACHYQCGHPLRWSPLRQEVMLDLIARKVTSSKEDLLQYPDILHKFIVWASKKNGTPKHYVKKTLKALKKQIPEYQAEINSAHHHSLPEDSIGGLADMIKARFDAMGLVYDDAMVEAISQSAMNDSGEGTSYISPNLSSFGDRLQPPANLKPLPLKEKVRLNQVPKDIKPGVVHAVQTADDFFADHPHLDKELRTAAKRLIAAVGQGNPDFFRDKRSDDTRKVALLLALSLFINSVEDPHLLVEKYYGLKSPLRKRVASLDQEFQDGTLAPTRPQQDFYTSSTREVLRELSNGLD